MALLFTHNGAIYVRCASRKAAADMSGIRSARKPKFIVEKPKNITASEIDAKIERLRIKMALLKIARG